MTDPKPLHVRVAIALGWTKERCVGNRDSWEALHPPVPIEGKPGFHWGNMSGPSLIPRYDTDWSATGPLIEKYGINLYFEKESGDWIGGFAPEGHGRWIAEDRSSRIRAETPLVAVCLLILALAEAGKLPVEVLTADTLKP